MESADRASGYFITRAEGNSKLNLRTSGVYLRADADDLSVLDGGDDTKRAELLAERMKRWKSIENA
jgi:hypothetical protein